MDCGTRKSLPPRGAPISGVDKWARIGSRRNVAASVRQLGLSMAHERREENNLCSCGCTLGWPPSWRDETRHDPTAWLPRSAPSISFSSSDTRAERVDKFRIVWGLPTCEQALLCLSQRIRAADSHREAKITSTLCRLVRLPRTPHTPHHQE